MKVKESYHPQYFQVFKSNLFSDIIVFKPFKDFKILNIKLYFHKLFHYEYWSSNTIYCLLAPVLVWNAIRAKSLTYFTAVNPNWNNGGLFGESKKAILDLIPSEYKPFTKTIKISDNLNQLDVLYPFIAKPILGERGKGVVKINNFSEWKIYHQTTDNEYIIQEFIDYPIELGVFYSRKPSEPKGKISSVTQKEFLHIIGDGKQSFEALIFQNIRALLHLKKLEQKFYYCWKEVVPNGKMIELEGIGNHCKGTRFINANRLINNDLEDIFEAISCQIDGFQYGRFDLRVPSLNDLYAGKNIKIMELNGTNSEPTHIYDESVGFLKAYRDLAWHWTRMTDITIENKKLGIKSKNAFQFLKELKNYR